MDLSVLVVGSVLTRVSRALMGSRELSVKANLVRLTSTPMFSAHRNEARMNNTDVVITCTTVLCLLQPLLLSMASQPQQLLMCVGTHTRLCVATHIRTRYMPEEMISRCEIE